MSDSEHLRRTPLHPLHLARRGRMVPFAGYEMPVRYEAGPVSEHQHCRTAAALFDVAHMGIVEVTGPGAAAALEALVPADVVGLGSGRMRYTVLTNEVGGVVDDVMVAKDSDDRLVLVVNAGGKEADVAHLRAGLPHAVAVEHRTDLALLALQGPEAGAVMARLAPAGVDGRPAPAQLTFLGTTTAIVAGVPAAVSRSGYTGEDGFELGVAADQAVEVAEALLAEHEVQLSGLAARDSLRLEAGLCLYGHDLDPNTTPVEAGLAWTIQKRRRAEGGFPGADVILAQLAEGPPRRRVGLEPQGRKPVRDGAALRIPDGRPVGLVTSGGYGPTAGRPIAMGYVAAGSESPGTPVVADVRGADVPCQVVPLPFVPHRYARGA